MKDKGYAKFGGSGVCGRQIRCIVGNVQVAYKAFSHTRPASMQIYWNKRKRLHNKRVQLQHGRRFIVLGHQYGRREIM